MAEKLYAGETFPSLTFDIVGGGKITVPDEIDTKYLVALFYRGHW